MNNVTLNSVYAYMNYNTRVLFDRRRKIYEKYFTTYIPMYDITIPSIYLLQNRIQVLDE